jgi:hypothetical protein
MGATTSSVSQEPSNNRPHMQHILDKVSHKKNACFQEVCPRPLECDHGFQDFVVPGVCLLHPVLGNL